MKHTSGFICSLLLCFSICRGQQPVIGVPAESKREASAKKDSVEIKTNRYGLRVGIDLFKLVRTFYEKDYRGIELVGDYRIAKRYFIAAELGNETKTVDGDQLNFTTKGSFIKVGFDYNVYENWLDMENLIYVGLRYGFSTFSQTLNSYTIYNRNHYFNEAQELPSGEKYSGLSASWGEAVIGVNAKVFNNIYVGFSAHLNKKFSDKKPDNFDNLYIPGFNRTYDGDFGVGFNYTVSYFIPIYRTKTEIRTKKK